MRSLSRKVTEKLCCLWLADYEDQDQTYFCTTHFQVHQRTATLRGVSSWLGAEVGSKCLSQDMEVELGRVSGLVDTWDGTLIPMASPAILPPFQNPQQSDQTPTDTASPGNNISQTQVGSVLETGTVPPIWENAEQNSIVRNIDGVNHWELLFRAPWIYRVLNCMAERSYWMKNKSLADYLKCSVVIGMARLCTPQRWFCRWSSVLKGVSLQETRWNRGGSSSEGSPFSRILPDSGRMEKFLLLVLTYDSWFDDFIEGFAFGTVEKSWGETCDPSEK